MVETVPPVSYTHLDVYKRQDIAVPPTSTANSGAVNSTIDAGIRG